MQNRIQQLTGMPLSKFPDFFTTLDPPDPTVLRGVYQGDFVGPGWLIRLAGPMLKITGLGGWWGKNFDDQGNAINLVCRNGNFKRLFPMLLRSTISFVDGRPGLALHYAEHNPFPWPLIVDELRQIEPGLLLGMSILKFKPLHRLALPFTLKSREDEYGL